ncbi:MAG: radical SAM family heme chaperone HemW [Spirochaetaceae bacterium]|jgi:oxygen-independent coproporphyrinogen-3 oxidase|nr:radical SAM family heme chaperone HemW [Spirochaetaceae bacterium]
MGTTCSLYIHIPFCARKCGYCAFYSVPVSPSEAAALSGSYVNALINDITRQIEFFSVSCIPTIYIGGGTPSVLSRAAMERLLAFLAALPVDTAHPVDAAREWTVEANPESVDADFLRMCKAHGVTRISAGVQTFNDASRAAIGRAGSAALVMEKLACIADVYADDFSCDLISGLPCSSPEQTARDIRQVAALGAGHISLYDLTLEEGTPLWQAAARGRAALPDADAACAAWLSGRKTLAVLGYRQYEVSSFARAGKECLHNQRYWRMESWLGAGAAASGTVIDDAAARGTRYSCAWDAGAYAAVLGQPRAGQGALAPLYAEEALDRPTLMQESLLMGMRATGGPDAALFRQRFSVTLESRIPGTLAKWRSRSLMHPVLPALNDSGLLFLNAFLRDAFAEIEGQSGASI